MAEDDKDKVVDFESLELEEDETKEGAPDKFEVLLSFVKERLSEEDFSNLQKELGIDGTEMSNEDLFAQIKALFEGKKPEEEEEEEPDETEMMDQQTFMEECLASGKDRDACLEEWKKKAPPESKEEGEPNTELAGKVEDLERKLDELAKAKDLGEVTSEVEKLIAAKHLAPVQREKAIKLASNLDAEERTDFYDFWKTQRFTISDDVGSLESPKPGTPGAAMTPEYRAEILKRSGLGDLIKDKGGVAPWNKEHN